MELMKWKKIKIHLSILSCLLIIIGYNNCGAGFESAGDFDPYENELGSTFGGGNGHGESAPPLSGESSFSTATKLGANKSSPFRMLTAFEVTNSLEDIFSISLPEIEEQKLLPEFSEEQFSNFQEVINVSGVHVSGIKLIAKLVNDKLSDQAIKKMFPCLNSAINNTCKNAIVNELSLSVLRKKVDSTLKGKYLAFLNSYNADAIKGTRLFIQALVQSPSFLSRQEVGVKKGNSYILNSFEIASRMSYFITGSTPDKTLLALAASGSLTNIDIRNEQAKRLFKSEKSRKGMFRINKEIFRIVNLGVNKSLATQFTKETELLFNSIIYEKDAPWSEIFSAKGSYMNRSLASHYGLTSDSQNYVWTSYTGDRQGILSHGSFLSYQYTGDPEVTSPIKRGLQIVEDLLCKHLPPPSDVDIDNDPAARLKNDCKIEARKKTTLHPKSSCFGCHTFMEPLGLSLERFNMLGQYRSQEKDRTECTTIEPGQIDGQQFNTMQELGSIMANHQDINLCLTKRVLGYAFGNFVGNDNVMSYNKDLVNFNNKKTFKNLVIDIVSSPQFVRRDL